MIVFEPGQALRSKSKTAPKRSKKGALPKKGAASWTGCQIDNIFEYRPITHGMSDIELFSGYRKSCQLHSYGRDYRWTRSQGVIEGRPAPRFCRTTRLLDHRCTLCLPFQSRYSCRLHITINWAVTKRFIFTQIWFRQRIQENAYK